MAGAIVIGGDYRGLGVTRSLGRRGIPVWVAVDDHRVGAMSRYCERRLDWPRDEESQLAFLKHLGREVPGWTVIPTADETAALVARHHDRLSRDLIVSVPEWETLRWAADKRLTQQLGDRLGIPTPVTRLAMEAIDDPDVALPAILKPAVKQSGNAFTDAKAWRVDSTDSLRRRFHEAARLVAPETILLQELLEGGGETQLSWGALCLAGEPVLEVTAKRLRQFPIDFGKASTFVVTDDDDRALWGGRRIAAELNWTGLIEVEFKLGADGRPRLLDVNPRVWGWASVGAAAGVDFGWGLWQMLRGQVPPRARARPHVGWVRLSTDIPAAAAYRRVERLSARRWASSVRGAEHALLARDDMAPALMEVPLHVARLVRQKLAPGL